MFNTNVAPYIEDKEANIYNITVNGVDKNFLMLPVFLRNKDSDDYNDSLVHAMTICYCYDRTVIDIPWSTSSRTKFGCCMLGVIYCLCLILSCISFISEDLFRPLTELTAKMNEIMDTDNKEEDIDLEEG